MNLYDEAHLFVAAIRLLQHKQNHPPELEEICAMLGVSIESGHATCRALKKRRIIETLEDPFTIKLSIAHHLEIENIPRNDETENSLTKEIEKFQAQKKDADKKIADMQAMVDKKKQDMLADIEAKFKKEMEKHNKG